MDVRIISFPKWVNLFKFLPYKAFIGLKYGAAFYFYKFKEHYDYIIANYPPSEWASIRNKNVVWYCHSPLRDAYDLYEYRQKNNKKDKFYIRIMLSIFRFIDKKAVKRIKTIIANSENVRKRIKKYFGMDSVVISPCLDPTNYTNNGDGKYFLYVSRFTPKKRQDFIVEVFKSFQRMYDKNKEYKLVLVGSSSTNPDAKKYFDELKDYVKDDPNIIIKTDLTDSEIKDLYSKCTAFLFAGLDEDFGIVPLEAMASGKPVISVNEGGPTEYIEDEYNGFLVSDIIEFADRMHYVASNPMNMKFIGENAIKTINQKYSCGEFYKKLDKALNII
jgi:glycosyltransferase involved in cell wall biosynthesis